MADAAHSMRAEIENLKSMWAQVRRSCACLHCQPYIARCICQLEAVGTPAKGSADKGGLCADTDYEDAQVRSIAARDGI